MSEWQECKLGDVVLTNAKSLDKSYTFETILYLDTGSITEGKIESFQEISLKDAPSRAKRLAKPNDIVYSTVRPIQRHYGLLKKPQPNLVVSTGFAVIEANQKFAHPEFIYYLLSSDESVEYLDVIAEASTSTYPSLKPYDIENMDISLPPVEEQKAIASVLSSLDDKIDLLHRQNTTLERMAETLFRQWFVEEAQESWPRKPLGEFVTIKRGGSPRPIQEFLSESGYRWLKISDVTSLNSPFIFDIKEHIKVEGLRKTVLLNAGSLVLSNSATPGIPKILTIESCIHDGWLHFPKSYFSNEFLYLLFNHIRPELISHGNGSIFTNLKTDILKEFVIPIPNETDLGVFQSQIKSIFDKLLSNAKQIQTLEKLRDNLLPKLMSGEVRVSKTKDVKKLSNPYSTGGGGYQFESHVQAAFVVLMLTDGHPPCFPNKKITKIKLQAKVDGFELDDMVVFMVDRATDQEHKLLAQIKHTVAITNDNKTFKEVICAAWKDFNLPANFKKSKDKLVLITGPISASDTENTRTILDWAHESGQSHIKYFEYIEKTNFSSDAKRKKLKAFEHNLKVANNDTSISDSDFFDFLKHFHFLGYDLDIKDGVTHSLLHSHIAQYYPSDVSAVWAQIVLYVQDVNKKSGTITVEDIPDEIKKYFKAPKLSYIPNEYVPEISKVTHKSPIPHSKSLVIANFLGSWKESASSDDIDLIKRFLNGL